MLHLQNISYTHPNRDLLFRNINLNISRNQKIALIGNNGSGKSTLFKLITGEFFPQTGFLHNEAETYLVPQIFGQMDHLTIAEALGVRDKMTALRNILAGKTTEHALNTLNEDWSIEERCIKALQSWDLNHFNLDQKLGNLSGGQKTKVFLAGISIHKPQLVLLDEPSNHLDYKGRELLQNFIKTTNSSMILVSHDRSLLRLVDTICELNREGISYYGGNYDFYTEQKRINLQALDQKIQEKKKTLRKAIDTKRESIERDQKANIRGKKQKSRSGLPKMAMNKLKDMAEKSSTKLKGIHAEKTEKISEDLHHLQANLPAYDKIKFNFDNSHLHHGKILFKATDMNFSYGHGLIWDEPLNYEIRSGERLHVKGLNGSGKTSLIKIILGELEPVEGHIFRSVNRSVYIDQDFSLIKDKNQVYEQAQLFNRSSLPEHDIKIRLDRFLFGRETWDKPCSALSGGERMRLLLCCLNISTQSPDMIVLDEPTNNLDIQNIDILIEVFKEYKGTLIIISHDETFIEQMEINRIITM